MSDNTSIVKPQNAEGTDLIEYEESPDKHFKQAPEIAKPLIAAAKETLSKIEKLLYSAPAFIDTVKSLFPDVTLQAVLTKDQKKKLLKGALRLLTKKDGSLLANLINPKTKKIVATIPLKEVQMSPEMSQAMLNFSTQMQMAQIAEQIQIVQHAVEEVRLGQEYDRLATAYSCQQKLLQAMEIKNPALKTMALMQLVSSAEDSRNLLMLSQKNNVDFIKEEPESFFEKIIKGSAQEKINTRINEIRENLYAINVVSLAEAVAYQELGESEAAKMSLVFFANFLKDTYIGVPGLLQRFDSIDPSPTNYWSTTIPEINKRIQSLSTITTAVKLDANKTRSQTNGIGTKNKSLQKQTMSEAIAARL